ncbi:hypothetical protein ACTXT7_000093 [Hymenolepis weldensis]
MCNAFSYGSLKEDQFRCLVFIQGLRSPCYAEIRLKLLSLLDKNPNITFHHLVDEYNNFRSLVADSNMVENHETRACQIKKPEIDQAPENNPPPQPQPQTRQTYSNKLNNKSRCRIQATGEVATRINIVKLMEKPPPPCYVADRDINLVGLD